MRITHPAEMTPDQRLDEVAEILATGVLRHRMKKAQQTGNTENIPLDNGRQMDPYVTVLNDGKKGKQP